jgi:DNA-binding beta-propeller fold protein YncE
MYKARKTALCSSPYSFPLPLRLHNTLNMLLFSVVCGIAFHIFAAEAQVQSPANFGDALPIADSDRIYTGDQSSNTITVIKPSTGDVLGTLALGGNRLSDVLNPQYIRSVNSHGLGFSRDGKYIVSLSVTSNTVTVIRCIDNSIVSQTFVDRNAHEAFFAADNRTVWVGTRYR